LDSAAYFSGSIKVILKWQMPSKGYFTNNEIPSQPLSSQTESNQNSRCRQNFNFQLPLLLPVDPLRPWAQGVDGKKKGKLKIEVLPATAVLIRLSL